MREFHIGHTVVPYEINWTEDRETIGFSLDQSLELSIRAPMTATLDDVESVLESRREWLLEKLYGLEEQSEPPYPREFLSGEKFPYRGREYRLEVVKADVPEPQLSFDGNEFTLSTYTASMPPKIM